MPAAASAARLLLLAAAFLPVTPQDPAPPPAAPRAADGRGGAAALFMSALFPAAGRGAVEVDCSAGGVRFPVVAILDEGMWVTGTAGGQRTARRAA